MYSNAYVYIMPTKKMKKIDLSKLTPDEMIKYEIAKELGVFDKVMSDGWKSLTAKETGKIGGMLASRRKKASAVKKIDETK